MSENTTEVKEVKVKQWAMVAEGTLRRTYADKTSRDFSVTKLFPDFLKYDEAQRGTIINGIKQKLEDKCAKSKDEKLSEAEKRVVHDTTWRLLSVDRKWNVKERAEKAPAVTLTVLERAILPMIDKGFDVEQISMLLTIPLERVKEIYNDSIEE